MPRPQPYRFAGNDAFFRRPVVLLSVSRWQGKPGAAGLTRRNDVVIYVRLPPHCLTYKPPPLEAARCTNPFPPAFAGPQPPEQDTPKQDMDNEIAERLASASLDVITRSGSPLMVRAAGGCGVVAALGVGEAWKGVGWGLGWGAGWGDGWSREPRRHTGRMGA